MNPLFDPAAHTDTIPRLGTAPVHALVVRCDYKKSITTTNVTDSPALHMYFGVVEDGSRGIVLEKTFFLAGTNNDKAALNLLAELCRTVGQAEPLTEDNVEAWCSSIATKSGPVLILTEEDPKSQGRYRRIRYINQPARGFKNPRDLKAFSEDLTKMTEIAAMSSDRLTLATGDGQIDAAI